MLRLYLPGVRAGESRVHIAGAEFRHLRTLRLEAGARLRVLDDAGGEHDVVLDRVGAREAIGRIVASARPERESPLDLVLAPALLKSTKMDLIVEKATELGVHRFAPMTTERVVGARGARRALAAHRGGGGEAVRTDPRSRDRPAGTVRRARRAAVARRCAWSPWEDEPARRLDELPSRAEAAVALIGPEGGFTPDEVALARAHDFVALTLGPRVLRAETAAIVVAAECQRRWGDA